MYFYYSFCITIFINIWNENIRLYNDITSAKKILNNYKSFTQELQQDILQSHNTLLCSKTCNCSWILIILLFLKNIVRILYWDNESFSDANSGNKFNWSPFVILIRLNLLLQEYLGCDAFNLENRVLNTIDLKKID